MTSEVPLAPQGLPETGVVVGGWERVQVGVKDEFDGVLAPLELVDVESGHDALDHVPELGRLARRTVPLPTHELADCNKFGRIGSLGVRVLVSPDQITVRVAYDASCHARPQYGVKARRPLLIYPN